MMDIDVEKDDIIKKTTGFSSCFLAETQIATIKPVKSRHKTTLLWQYAFYQTL
jgi:hypothetical protein